MKPVLLLSLVFCAVLTTQAQPPCQSAYDNTMNNSYGSTSYFMGPMTIPLNTDVRGAIHVANDQDYYKFYITTGGTITLTLTGLPANYHLKLVNENGSSIATSANGGNANETINFTVASNTFYYALVYPAGRKIFNASSCYTLRVNTGTAGMAPETADPAAATLDAITRREVVMYPNPADESIQVEVAGSEGMVRFVVLNARGERVAEHTAEGGRMRLDLAGYASGPYLVEVYGASGLITREKFLKR